MNKNDILIHYGVKGMKWGVRRYQNYDGKRIGSGEKKSGGIFGKSGSEKAFDKSRMKKGSLGRTSKEEHEIFKQKVLNESSKVDYTKMEKSRDEFNKLAEELGSEYPKAYEKMLNDKSNRDKMYEDTISYLEREFKRDRNDPAFYSDITGEEMWLREGIDYAITNNLPKSVVDKTNKMFEAGDDFFNEARNITESISDKYKDVTLRDVSVSKTSSGYTYDVSDKKGSVANGKDVADYYLSRGVNASWESYQYKHFDDYWVNDVDQRYKLEDALTREFSDRERSRAS